MNAIIEPISGSMHRRKVKFTAHASEAAANGAAPSRAVGESPRT